MPGAPTPGRLQVGIVPHNLAASLAFYRDVLGLTYTGTRPALEHRTLHLFSLGTATVKLLETAQPPPRRSDAGPYAETEGIRWLTLDIADLDPLIERCRAAGARLQLEPMEIRAGLRVAIVEDPDGNAIELVERA
jgi:catechol 2,3-dioxygenase-like lactoylglutathione lyase family enzyme